MKKLEKDLEDPRLVPIVKKKTFLISEKNYLYRYLVKNYPVRKTMEIYKESIENYVADIIKDYLYKDNLNNYLGKISHRLYKHLDSVAISICDLGLNNNPKTYIYKSDTSHKEHNYGEYIYLNMARFDLFKFPDDDHKNMDSKLYASKFYERLVKYCPKEKFISLVNMIEEYLKYWGITESYLDEYKNTNRWSGPEAFENIKTWGALYKCNKEWFDIVYQQYNCSLEQIDGKVLNSNDKIKKLESVLNL